MSATSASDPRPTLTVISGRPGTGKTTLTKALARRRPCCYLRVDAAETALARHSVDVGVQGYAVIHELAVSNLELGIDVVVDAVNPVPEARVGWLETAARGGAELVHVETWLPDDVEHRRRVETRTPDIPDQRVPSWSDVEAQRWVPWDARRDGPRTLIETSDSARALAAILTITQEP
jgi:predicted kinase